MASAASYKALWLAWPGNIGPEGGMTNREPLFITNGRISFNRVHMVLQHTDPTHNPALWVAGLNFAVFFAALEYGVFDPA